MTVVVATFGGEIAQPAERIAGEIQRARFLGGARREDQGNAVLVAPILDGGAQDAQAESIGDDGPEAAIGGVQNLLRQQERRPAAQALGGPVAEALMRAVEVLRMRGEHQRHTTPKRVEADRESAFADHDLTDRLQIGEAEHLPAEWDKEFLDRESMRVEVGALATDLEIAPEVLRDLPVTAHLFAP